ncbi:DUF305 domain-containing protein [Desulfonatronum thiodismutans]|uniref:DUF305 domain-containing protein n=1 Tax=Desulfonatronum thiodismutans TaxID=159290 RepID=UPI0006917130|nr:DUF305 domain-containing protein [Desulfonatronum thiodismutans]
MMKTMSLMTFWMPLAVLSLLFMTGPHGPADAEEHGHQHQVGSELEFLVEMIPHHQEAVDSAKQIMAVTERKELRDFAKEVMDTQAEEIAKMRQWIKQWHPDAAMQATYQPMMREIEGLSAKEADIVFLEDMIEHHLAAVHMARDVLDKNLSERDEVRILAEEIIAAQNREIDQMREWLEQWGGASAPAGHHGH